ncbi:MAG: hypothetical protein JXB32_10230 [Deltaproteobacteria bacterium]|nr:hypothetical protein [Deltaproteobacteria bacterium]
MHNATTQPERRTAARLAVPAALALLLAAAACSDGNGPSDPCDGVSCSMYGTCITDGNLPFCSCQAGYHPVGLDCVPNDPVDPCLDVACNLHGTCGVEAGLPVCDCDDGYRPDASSLLCFPVPTDADADADAEAEADVEPDAEGEADVPDTEPDVPDTDAEADVPDTDAEPDVSDAEADGEVVVECTVDGDCEDYNVCTDDQCSPEGLCRYLAVADDSPCTDDGNDCTADVCRRGACSHRPLADGTACAGDDEECTDDVCSAGACAHPALADGTACVSDGNDCTGDVCAAGTCAHPALADGTACASDGNDCTDDVCAAGACAHPALADGTACFTDGNECTADICGAGTCVHEPTPGASCTDDGNACTAEACDESGGCVHEPIAGCCNVAADCDDGNPCTTDACDGSSHTCRAPVVAADGTVCGFLGESCFAGRCAREVIVNGTFDSGDTTGWTLQDLSTRGDPCTGYYGDWSVTGGRLRLHGHSATGIAAASQDFPAARPLRVRFDYELTTSCGGGNVALHDGGTMLLNWDRATYFSGRGKDAVTWYTPFIAAAPGTCLTAEGETYRSDIVCEQVSGSFCYRSGCTVSTMTGTFEAVFDWTTNRVTMSAGGVTLGTYAILNPTTFQVARLRLAVGHGCCDGRWDSYFAVDNVSVLVEVP